MKCMVAIRDIVGIASLLFLLVGCNFNQRLRIEYRDKFEIASDALQGGKRFGGLSGIDYDAKSGDFYLITDDRLGGSDSQCYKFHFSFKGINIDTLTLSSLISLKSDSPGISQQANVDFESIRFNPVDNDIVVGNEGGSIGKSDIRIYHLNGALKYRFPVDSAYLNELRPNKSFESLSFSSDYKSLYYAAETALWSDGEEASLKNGSLIRVIKSKAQTGKVEQQFLYWLEKIPKKAEVRPPWNGLGCDNGLSEILVLDKQNFLMLERSGAYRADGGFDYTCRVFLASIPKTEQRKQVVELQKELLFDFSLLPFKTYNIEGVTLGPVLNGKQTLLFVSDNNFSANPSVIYLFTIDNRGFE